MKINSEMIFLLNFLVLADCLSVGIIGGGIGGSSVAYFLRKIYTDPLEIDLYNNGEIGGRLSVISMRFNGIERYFESGGSVIHPGNVYINDWLNEFELSKRQKPINGKYLGIWNGEKFVFEKSDWFLITFIRFLFNYGLDTLKSRLTVNNFVNQFSMIYSLLNDQKHFNSIEDLVQSASFDLTNLLNITLEDYLIQNNYGKRFIYEYASSIINCNYGQSVKDVNAFSGSVGLAGSVSGLYSINGSNLLLVKKLLDYSRANIINAEVKEISKINNKYVIRVDRDENVERKEYDFIILAVPLHQQQTIKIDGLNLSNIRGFYTTIFATFVEGTIRNSYWKISDGKEIGNIFVSNNELSYNSIGQILPVDYIKGEKSSSSGSHKIYKIFSKRNLSEVELNNMFSEIQDVKAIKFLAYPDYSKPPKSKPEFRIADRICHVNAIEWLSSAIEMSAIGARNCVNMLISDSYSFEKNRLKADDRLKDEL